MRSLLWFAAGAALVGAPAAPPAPPPPAPVVVPALVPVVLPAIAVPPPPATAAPVGCVERPAEVGRRESPDELDAGSGWRIVTSPVACALAVWSERDVFASWDDGRTFTRVLDGAADVISAAFADDGTLYVMRGSQLGIAHADGARVWRPQAVQGELVTGGRWLAIHNLDGASFSDDAGVTWRHLDLVSEYLMEFRVAPDGTIVMRTDISMLTCDHFGCPDETTHVMVRHLDGRPWREATRREARRLLPWVDPAVLPDPIVAWRALDSHRLPMRSRGGRLLRYTGRGGGWRVLFEGTPSW